jgi:hypothetical protein
MEITLSTLQKLVGKKAPIVGIPRPDGKPFAVERATHFAIEYGSIDGKRVAYRQGYCAKCAPEYAKGRKLHPIPGLPKRETS